MAGSGVAAVVLAAGYGTRLERDLREDASGKFSNLVGLPKALVPVGGKPLLDYWLDAFAQSGVAPVFVVCNARHEPLFRQWAADGEKLPQDHILCDGSTSNEERRGAIGALRLAFQQKRQELHGFDVLAVAGDTLFDTDFQLDDVLRDFKALPSGAGESLITYYELHDPQEVTKRGIIEVDDTKRVVKFLEKPKVEETTSRKACPPLYIYSRAVVPLIEQYVDEAAGQLALLDAPGSLVAWLSARVTVRAHHLSASRFDIGSLRDYGRADDYFHQRRQLETSTTSS